MIKPLRVGNCAPLQEVYGEVLETLEPHLDGLFDDAKVPSDGSVCTGDICDGCLHNRYATGSRLLGLINLLVCDPDWDIDPSVVREIVTIPEMASRFQDVIGGLGVTPTDLRTLLADPTFARVAGERLEVLKTREKKVLEDQEKANVPLGSVYVLRDLHAACNTEGLHYIDYFKVMISVLDKDFVCKLIDRESKNPVDAEALKEFYYGDYEGDTSKKDRAQIVANNNLIGAQRVTSILPRELMHKIIFNLRPQIVEGIMNRVHDVSALAVIDAYDFFTKLIKIHNPTDERVLKFFFTYECESRPPKHPKWYRILSLLDLLRNTTDMENDIDRHEYLQDSDKEFLRQYFELAHWLLSFDKVADQPRLGDDAMPN